MTRYSTFLFSEDEVDVLIAALETATMGHHKEGTFRLLRMLRSNVEYDEQNLRQESVHRSALTVDNVRHDQTTKTSRASDPPVDSGAEQAQNLDHGKCASHGKCVSWYAHPNRRHPDPAINGMADEPSWLPSPEEVNPSLNPSRICVLCKVAPTNGAAYCGECWSGVYGPAGD